MYCKYCGSLNDDGNSYCISCGKPLVDTEESGSSYDTYSSKGEISSIDYDPTTVGNSSGEYHYNTSYSDSDGYTNLEEAERMLSGSGGRGGSRPANPKKFIGPIIALVVITVIAVVFFAVQSFFTDNSSSGGFSGGTSEPSGNGNIEVITEDTYINVVRYSYLDADHDDDTIGDAFSWYFDSPNWEFFTDKDDGSKVVEFTGYYTTGDDETHNVLVQYVIEEDLSGYETWYYEIDEESYAISDYEEDVAYILNEYSSSAGYIGYVKYGYLDDDHKDIYFGDAFDWYYNNAKWDYFVTEDDENIVEFTGTFTDENGAEHDVCIQFMVYDDEDYFDTCWYEIDGVGAEYYEDYFNDMTEIMDAYGKFING